MDLKQVGEQANRLEDDLGLSLDAVLNKLTQELGEFNDAVQKARGIYCKTRATDLRAVEGEAGDLMMNLVSVLYRLGLDPNDLPQYAANTFAKFEERKELYRQNLASAAGESSE